MGWNPSRFEHDAQDLFKELTDDLLYHGDLNAAMRRLMQQGFQDRHANQMVVFATCWISYENDEKRCSISST